MGLRGGCPVSRNTVPEPGRARSSAGEHHLDTVGVTGSIPVAPTILSINKTAMLPPDKNLQASVSPALLARMQQAAQDERLTVDQFIEDAIERRLNRREFEGVLALGKRHARARGLKPADVAEGIAAVRRGNKEHGR